MHRLTLFGRFVEDLRKSITDVGGRRFKKSDLVFYITGQADASQASRYLRVFDEDKSTFWYHKSTIARMIASAGQEVGMTEGMIRRKSRGGYEFIGTPESAMSVRVLADSIDRLWNENESCFILREALERYGLSPDCAFCAGLYKAYAQEYGVDDLEACVRATCAELTGPDLVAGVYKTLLVCVLLGPPATYMMLGTNAVTPQGLGGGFRKVLDGFSLMQLVEAEGGMLLPTNDFGFELDSEVVIGRDARDGVAYVPLRGPSGVSYVSGLHASVQPTGDGEGWELRNLSGTNGTTVYHVDDGSLRFMAVADEVEPLHPGDELWLAPLPAGVGSMPSYEYGAVLRFEHLYEYVAYGQEDADGTR